MKRLCAVTLLLIATAARSATVIPVRIYERLFLVPVRIGGKPFTFVLQTAAAHSYIDRRLHVRAPVIATIGDQRIAIQHLTPIDLSNFERSEGRHIDGILGGELFARFAVEMDSDAAIVRLHDAAAFHYGGKGETIPITMSSGKPYVTASLKLKGRAEQRRTYLLDTGSADAIDDDLFKEAGGTLVGPDLARAERFTIGSLQFEGVNGTSGGPSLGGELLHRFHVIADFSHSRLILEPNRFYGDAFLFDASGIDMQLHRRGFEIVRVFAKTPAAEAQLRIGDIITHIDHASVRALGLERARLMLHQVRDYELQ
ncbi:MAG TPA: PDZ domain-containing protein, partial [Thermoanaerobaculia bacterium]|nr:PDZ domain-containing protein [Thermoanaerobaculia bacterium]